VLSCAGRLSARRITTPFPNANTNTDQLEREVGEASGFASFASYARGSSKIRITNEIASPTPRFADTPTRLPKEFRSRSFEQIAAYC